MDANKLKSTAQALVADAKGLLAADESSPTIKKRFESVGTDSTEDTRCAYRQMLFTTPGIEEFISGVIMFDETIRRCTADGVPLRELLQRKGIMPGIKVDESTAPLANYSDEKITEGLDGLRDRLAEYRDLGARFAKWRAVITISDGIPTQYCIAANARMMAHYAAICQEMDIVPLVEPEVLMDGDHTIERCAQVTEDTLDAVFFELHEQRVLLEGMLLKTNMVLPGKDSQQKASAQQVAERTVQIMRRSVPTAVPGIVFLSGGQTSEQATENLDAMNRMGTHPWPLSFSFARALQDLPMRAWRGNPQNVPEAQRLFYQMAKNNHDARLGKYMQTAKIAA